MSLFARVALAAVVVASLIISVSSVMRFNELEEQKRELQAEIEHCNDDISEKSNSCSTRLWIGIILPAWRGSVWDCISLTRMCITAGTKRQTVRRAVADGSRTAGSEPLPKGGSFGGTENRRA